MLPRMFSSPARNASTPARVPATTSTRTGSGAQMTVSTLRRGRPSRTLTRPTLTATVQQSPLAGVQHDRRPAAGQHLAGAGADPSFQQPAQLAGAGIRSIAR